MPPILSVVASSSSLTQNDGGDRGDVFGLGKGLTNDGRNLEPRAPTEGADDLVPELPTQGCTDVEGVQQARPGARDDSAAYLERHGVAGLGDEDA